jgi:hypothetical protein
VRVGSIVLPSLEATLQASGAHDQVNQELLSIHLIEEDCSDPTTSGEIWMNYDIDVDEDYDLDNTDLLDYK